MKTQEKDRIDKRKRGGCLAQRFTQIVLLLWRNKVRCGGTLDEFCATITDVHGVLSEKPN